MLQSRSVQWLKPAPLIARPPRLAPPTVMGPANSELRPRVAFGALRDPIDFSDTPRDRCFEMEQASPTSENTQLVLIVLF